MISLLHEQYFNEQTVVLPRRPTALFRRPNERLSKVWVEYMPQREVVVVTKRGRRPDIGWNPTSRSEDSEEGEPSLVPILDS